MVNFGDIKPAGPLGYEWEEINRLRKVNAALLEALERAYTFITFIPEAQGVATQARAAIAQAKGGQA